MCCSRTQHSDRCCHLLTLTFSKNSFRNTIRVSNDLDPDQDRFSVGPDLGPNHLHLRFHRMSCNYGLNIDILSADLLLFSQTTSLHMQFVCSKEPSQ